MGKIRFVGPGETRGYPYLVCKIYFSGLHTWHTRFALDTFYVLVKSSNKKTFS